MAKKKKSTKRRGSRRRMSGIGKDTLTTVAGLAVGAIGARQVQKVIPGNGKIISGVQIAGGALIINKARDPFMRGIGYGMMATGTTDLMTQMRVISGVDDDSYTALVPMGAIEDPINGFDEDPINGFVQDPMNGPGDMDGWDSMQGTGDETEVDDLDEAVVGYNY